MMVYKARSSYRNEGPITYDVKKRLASGAM